MKVKRKKEREGRVGRELKSNVERNLKRATRKEKRKKIKEKRIKRKRKKKKRK